MGAMSSRARKYWAGRPGAASGAASISASMASSAQGSSQPGTLRTLRWKFPGSRRTPHTASYTRRRSLIRNGPGSKADARVVSSRRCRRASSASSRIRRWSKASSSWSSRISSIPIRSAKAASEPASGSGTSGITAHHATVTTRIRGSRSG